MSSPQADITTAAKPKLAAQTMRHRIEELLIHEADLLDRRQFSEWLEMLSPDFSYRVPVPEVVEAGIGLRHDEIAYLVDETRYSFEMWVERVTGSLATTAWSERPPLRTRHVTSNVKIIDRMDGALIVRSNVLLALHHLDGPTVMLSAERIDEIQPNLESSDTEGRLLFSGRRVLLDAPVVQALHLRFPI